MLCAWPALNLISRFLLSAHAILFEKPSALRSVAAEFCAAMEGMAEELDYLWHHPCWVHVPLELPLAALGWNATSLVASVFIVLGEQKLLLHAHGVHLLLPFTEMLMVLLYPLRPCGIVIPYLPSGLHSDPETLLNDSPDPFVVGVHTTFFRELSLLPADDGGPAVIDLDSGVVYVPRRVQRQLNAPLVSDLIDRLAVPLARAASAGVLCNEDALGIQAAFLDTMSRLVQLGGRSPLAGRPPTQPWLAASTNLK